jgi:glutaredoxin
MVQKDSPKKKEAPPSSPLFGSRGMVAGAIIIAVIISLVAVILATSTPVVSSAMPPQDCGRAVISYLNANLVQAGSTAELVSLAEKNGVYEIMTLYQGRNIPLYATRDCSLLFTNSFDLKATPATPTPTTTPEPVKSSRPAVELFVMAFCPYGVQAETAMDPVVGLLGGKANISVRYIASVGGTTVDSVSSLHGPVEAKEDLRQLCIAKYYPSQLWQYLMDFNANCYSLYQDATRLDACRANTTGKLGMDTSKIETCASGSEGLALLEADEAITGQYGVTGSPTLIINGQVYSGDRTPEAYKQAICSRFGTPPAECGTTLSSQAATSSGGCG